MAHSLFRLSLSHFSSLLFPRCQKVSTTWKQYYPNAPFENWFWFSFSVSWTWIFSMDFNDTGLSASSGRCCHLGNISQRRSFEKYLCSALWFRKHFTSFAASDSHIQSERQELLFPISQRGKLRQIPSLTGFLGDSEHTHNSTTWLPPYIPGTVCSSALWERRRSQLDKELPWNKPVLFRLLNVDE